MKNKELKIKLVEFMNAGFNLYIHEDGFYDDDELRSCVYNEEENTLEDEYSEWNLNDINIIEVCRNGDLRFTYYGDVYILMAEKYIRGKF